MGAPRIVLDCGSFTAPDLDAIDRLARLGLEAKRRGCEPRLARTCPNLLELIDFCGLAAVLRVEVERQAEEREKTVGVEEECQLTDPPT
jgi:hypothetical protein